MSARVKYHVIYRHREEYPISVMCAFFAVSRSGYYAFVQRLDRPEKDAALAEVIGQQQERSFRTYGYRRMWLWLRSQNIFRNPKTVLRVMKKYGLLSEIRRRRKWQQMGQQVHRYENLLNREFHADRPNSKWVTDISYIHTKQGVLYLSMIRDLYDNSIVAYKTGTQQTVNLVLDTIRLAMKQREKEGRCGVAAPQRPRLSIHLTSIFPADSNNTALRLPCQDEETRMTMPWRKISSPSSKRSAFTATNRPPSRKPTR